MMENGALVLSAFKVFGLGAVSFIIGMIAAPTLRTILYELRAWPPKSRSQTLTGENAEVVNRLRKEEKKDVPRMGGIIIWGTTLLITLLFWVLSEVFQTDLLLKLNFLSRNQTWLPLFTLVVASVIGLIDDVLFIRSSGGYVAGGIALRKRILLVTVIAFIGAWWFYFQLDESAISVPFFGLLHLGILYIPFFILVMLATFSGGIIDGLDGLAGGTFAAMLAAYLGIAFFQQQIDIATFLSVVIGAILAFLWYNIPPASFYMGETGILGLTTMITVIAFLTNGVAVLPIIALPLVLTSGSAILQIAWKRYAGKKLFRAAPLHHHFEALGWTQPQVTMRYWVFSTVCAVIGMALILIG